MARPFYYVRCMALGAAVMAAVSISHTATAASADFGWTVAPHVYVIDLNYVDVAVLPAIKADINVPTKQRQLQAAPAVPSATLQRHSTVSFSGGRTGYHMIC